MSYALSQIQHLVVHPFLLKMMPEHDLALVDYRLAYPALFEGPDEHILRDFRGVTFRISTGEIVSRPYHKFFNLGEAPETKEFVIDWTQPHCILEKLDGSMVRPYSIGGDIRFATRMGLTDVAAQADVFCQSHQNILDFADLCLDQGLTPIFEWCSRQNRVVIDHPQDRMVLTAIRSNVSGRYMPYKDMKDMAEDYGVEVVRAYEGVEDLDAFVKHTRNLENAEGYVVRFDDGLFFKIKADQYVGLHKVLGLLQSESTMVEMTLHGTLDDAIGRFRPEDQLAIREFQQNFWKGVETTVREVDQIVAQNKHLDRKTFALTVATRHPLAPVLFAGYAGNSSKEFILTQIEKAINGLDRVAHLWGGERWGRQRRAKPGEE